MRSVDLLHVPTPWHNCLVEVVGHATLTMTKSNAVKAALSSGKFVGGWIPGIHHGLAGYFRLQPIESMQPKIKALLMLRADSEAEEWHEEINVPSDKSGYASVVTTTDSYLVYMQ